MKIAFVVTQFPSTSETFVLNQITDLIDRGHDVDIYAGIPGDLTKAHQKVQKYQLLDKTYYGVSIPRQRGVYYLKALWLWVDVLRRSPRLLFKFLSLSHYGRHLISPKFIYLLASYLNRTLSYDIIHCHFGTNGVRGALLRELGILQGKLVTTFHGSDVTKTLLAQGTHIYDALFQTVDQCQPISQRWRRVLLSLGCHPNKITVHHMGIDCDRFHFTSRHLRSDGQVRLISVARLTEKKGIEYSIRAVAQLLKTYPNIHYDIIGDGPLQAELEQLIHSLDVEAQVKLLGWKAQRDVIELLHQSDILVAPSVTSKTGDQEGIPVAIMESMAMGLPVVSTWHSGIPELVADGVSGFLVPERDVDALAQRLAYLVNHPHVWAALGRAGRNRVEEHFNNQPLSDRLVELYATLVTEQKIVAPLPRPAVASI